MIIRKPYAFLIKNFKKIHIALLAIAVYIYFKTTQTYSFVNQFIMLASYDSYNEPIGKYASIFSILLLLILVVGSGLILLLLRKKEKPWKLYLIPTVQYFIILLSFLSIRSYFHAYTGVETTTSLRVWRDLLFVSQAIQLGVLVIYTIRIFGIDLNKFNFKLDEEYLELEQSDKEELEISIDFDKNSLKRLYRKFLRNFNYFYQEHKLLCRIVILIFIIIMGKNAIGYISNHRAYKQGDTFNVYGYTVKINNSYYSDKSYNGTVISNKSGFVIVDVSIKNNLNKSRDVDLNKYHIMNGVNNYTPTEKTYETEFKDLGKAYDSVTLKSGEESRMLLIYKVDKKLSVNRFVLYYQELEYNSRNLRKIKLKINDLSKIVTMKTLDLGESITMNLNNDEENINFESYEVVDEFSYDYKTCRTDNCTGTQATYKSPAGYKVIVIPFGSDTYEGKDMASLVANQGKIVYQNSKGKNKTIEIENALNRTYYGKYVYIKVPDEVVNSKSIKLQLILRNKKYVYKIK